jgi:hypothetical protein
MSGWMTIPTPHWHQDINIDSPSISGWAGDQILRVVVLPSRLTGAVYHRFLVNDLQLLLKHVPFDQHDTCGSCMIGQYLIFSALSDST